MKKIIKTIAFQIGVDILGFPVFHNHSITTAVICDGRYFKAHSKK